MNPNDAFDRHVSEWLHADGEHRVPEHLDAVLRRTRSERQRPAWSSLERWLPVQTTLRLSPVPRLAWLLAVIAILVALAATALLVASRPRLPDPFGPARNGAIVSSVGGDLLQIDPTSQIAHPVVVGATYDFAPYFSRDGRRLMFLRTSGPPADGTPLRVVVADADGTNAQAVTPPIGHLDWADWSPDGTRIGMITRPSGETGVLSIVDVASATVTAFDLGVSAQIAYWLPPDGREIVLSATTPGPVSGEPIPAIYAVRSDGTGLRKLTDRPAADKDDFQGPVASPDGQRISYTSWNPIGRIHILELRTGSDLVLPDPTGSTSQAGIAVFSPDGRQVAYPRYVGDTYQLVVAPVDGSSTGVAIGPRLAMPAGGSPGLNYDFTPDGSALVAMYGHEAITRLLPVAGSAGSILGQGADSFATIQRLAP